MLLVQKYGTEIQNISHASYGAGATTLPELDIPVHSLCSTNISIIRGCKGHMFTLIVFQPLPVILKHAIMLHISCTYSVHYDIFYNKKM